MSLHESYRFGKRQSENDKANEAINNVNINDMHVKPILTGNLQSAESKKNFRETYRIYISKLSLLAKPKCKLHTAPIGPVDLENLYKMSCSIHYASGRISFPTESFATFPD